MKRTLLLMSVACSLLAFGGEYAIKSSLDGQVFDWTDGRNFEGGVAPVAGQVDQVRIPDNVNVVISNGISQASLDVINGLIRIRPWGANATITFYVDENETLAIACPINKDWQNAEQGHLVKTGKGTLELNYATSVVKPDAYGYAIRFDVREGTVRFPQSVANEPKMVLAGLKLATGTFFYPLMPAATEIKNGLSGAGTITNEASYASYKDYKTLSITGPTGTEPAVFAGAIRGLFSLEVSGNQHFTGTNTTSATVSLGTSDSRLYGPTRTCNTVGVKKFGKQGAYDVTKFYPSSIGYHQIVFRANGAHVLSLGEEDETTDKLFVTFPPADDTIRYEFDGGARGGVTFEGEWSMHAGAPNVRRIYLTGSNTAHACVLANKFVRTKASTAEAVDANYHSFTFVKEGSGIWRFADTSDNSSKRATDGLLAVRDGTVEVESLKEKGTACCIGTSNKPYPSDYYETTTDTSKMADYAIELGSSTASTTGTLAYVGASAVSCATRTIAMMGNGRLSNASTRNFDWSGVRTVGTGARTLFLDGDDTAARNTIDGVTDSASAPLTLVKEGAGTWRVGANVSLCGDVVVRDGTLVLDDATRYTWYKWVIKSTYSETVTPTPANTISLTCGEFGLYSADGRRQNADLTYRRLAYPNLSAGESDYGFTSSDGFSPAVRTGNYHELTKLFDASIASDKRLTFWYSTAADQAASGTNRNVPHHDPTQETTWLPIVMRLSEDAQPVTRFDYANVANKNNAATYRTVLYASVNGTDWTEVAAEAALEPKAQWQLADRAFAEGGDDVHTNALGQVDGQEIAAFPASVTGEYLKDVSSYSVSPGATLKILSKTTIKGLTVDGAATGTGEIQGGTLAANGTVTLEGVDRRFESVELPLRFENVVGLANIADWTYRLADGAALDSSRLRVTVADGKVTVARVRKGLAVIIR